MSFIEYIKIGIGVFFILFIPGFIWSYIFFKKDAKKIDYIKRIVFSIAISFLFISILTYLISLARIPINYTSTLVTSLAITLVGIVIIFFNNIKNIIIKK